MTAPRQSPLRRSKSPGLRDGATRLIGSNGKPSDSVRAEEPRRGVSKRQAGFQQAARHLLPIALAIACWLAADVARAEPELLDAFESLDGWSVITSEGATLELVNDIGYRGRGMRLDFDLRGGGYVNAKKRFDLPLPDNYVFSFRLRGDTPRNGFEFKVLDPTGRNVWWYNDRNLDFPKRWERVQVRKSRLEFAWGPSGGAPLTTAGALEFTISAATGGKGSVWIDELEIAERDPFSSEAAIPTVTASTETDGFAAQQVLAGDVGWRSEPVPHPQWLLVDFGKIREYGGLVLTWDDADFATSYQILTSDTGRRWTALRPNQAGNGGRDYIDIQDGESRFIKIEMDESSRRQGYAIRALEIRPFAFSATANHFFEAIASEAPRGWYPRYLLREQAYWTVIGVDGDNHEALVGSDGAIENGEGSFSVEPFLSAGGQLLSWADGHPVPSLLDGYLPVPTVTWTAGVLVLEVTAFASGQPGAAATWARYRVRNTGSEAIDADLFLAIRPFQVNPPWQSLHRPGGVSPIRRIRIDAEGIRVNEHAQVVLLTPPNESGAAGFAESSTIEALAKGTVPSHTAVEDLSGYASAAARYGLRLGPGESRDVFVAMPFPGTDAALMPEGETSPEAHFAALLAAVREDWGRKTDRVAFSIPGADEHLARIARSAVAQILINADGPAIQPGSRAYARSWIRDGAITAGALLQMGSPQQVGSFLRWYAPQQWPSGKVPCCIDDRGRDPVPEHDSPGQLIHTVAEYYRFTRDVGLVADLWKHVVAAVDYITMLRSQRLTPEYNSANLRVFRGLLPESISHEGYASQPAHSYWDDFFAIRGLRDAAFLATVVGDPARARSYEIHAREMREDVGASIELAMKRHGIDFIPGAAELGDYDPSSTAIAVTPLDEAAILPPDALRNTFAGYLHILDARLAGGTNWETYSPYELRIGGALLRLGEPTQSLRILRAMVADQRPAAWNQWQEIVWRDPAAPRFIGDMPHTWIASMFVSNLRALFAYEDESADALVLGAGLAPEWIAAPEGVGVMRLPTHFGTLSLHVRRESDTVVRVRIGGDVRVPSGLLKLRLPLSTPLRRVLVDGEPISTFDDRSATIACAQCTVDLTY